MIPPSYHTPSTDSVSYSAEETLGSANKGFYPTPMFEPFGWELWEDSAIETARFAMPLMPEWISYGVDGRILPPQSATLPWLLRLLDVLGYWPTAKQLGCEYVGLTAGIRHITPLFPDARLMLKPWDVLWVEVQRVDQGRTSLTSRVRIGRQGTLNPYYQTQVTQEGFSLPLEIAPCQASSMQPLGPIQWLFQADGVVNVALDKHMQKLPPDASIPLQVLPPGLLGVATHEKQLRQVQQPLWKAWWQAQSFTRQDIQGHEPAWVIRPHHLNVHGKAFGGVLLAAMVEGVKEEMLLACYALEQLSFLSPVTPGMHLTTRVGATSQHPVTPEATATPVWLLAHEPKQDPYPVATLALTMLKPTLV
ncbi:MAG: hypothetical protein ACKO37_07980 [Vampirovibrionales bacterium]